MGPFNRNVSSDGAYSNVPPRAASSERASSTHDIRQTFSGAISYQIPDPGERIWKSIFGGWSADSIVYSRTAPPVILSPGRIRLVAISLELTASSAPISFMECQSGSPIRMLPGKDNQQNCIQCPDRDNPRKSQAQKNGFGATEVDLTLRRRSGFTHGLPSGLGPTSSTF